MDTVYKHKIYCETDSKWVDTLAENDTAITTCPDDAGHTVTAGSASICASISKGSIQAEQLPGKTYDNLKIRGKVNQSHTKTTTTDYSYAPAEDFYIKDGQLLTEDHVFGDSITIELYNAVPTLLYTYVKDCPISADGVTSFEDETLSNTNFNGLSLKVLYTSVGTVNDVKSSLRLNGIE